MNAGSSQARVLLGGALWIVYAVLWLGGVGGHLLFGGTPPGMTWTAPVFLLVAASLVIVSAPSDWRAMLLSLLAGLATEAVGVATGYPFGSYSYTASLAPAVLGVPLVMGGAWMVLVAFVRQLRLPAWAGALAMAAFDLVIDPLAANTLGYWKWKNPGPYYGVPLANFAGWFLGSYFILLALRAQPRRNRAVFLVGSTILLFFALLSLAHGFLAPTSIGFLLCGGGYWRWRSSMVSTRI